MKQFHIYIKADEGPDYEGTLEAETKEEAAEKFAENIGRRGGDWSPVDLMQFIEENNG